MFQQSNWKHKIWVRIPCCVKEALQNDNANSNDLWKDAIIKEIGALMGDHVLWSLKETWKQLKKGGHHFAPLRMIFDVKQDGCRKARLVIEGHVLDADNMDTYSSVMKTILAHLLVVIAKANNYQVLTRDIKNVYLYTDYDINICTCLRPELKLAGFKEMKTRSMAKVEKTL